MNVFFHELKEYRNGLFWWSVGMVALISSGMAKFATLEGTGQSINALLDQFPKSIQTVFGLTGFDLTKPSGYYGVLFMYIALLATVHAVLSGVSIISKEERDRTSEFLFVKPMSRKKIITAKLLAGLFNIVVLNIVTMLSSLFFIAYFNKGNSLIHDVMLLMVALAALQVLYFSIGIAIAAIVKKVKASASIATSVLLVTFILTFLINMNGHLDNLKYLTPFKYFDAKDLLLNGHIDPIFGTISAVITMALILTTYLAFKNRDLSI